MQSRTQHDGLKCLPTPRLHSSNFDPAATPFEYADGARDLAVEPSPKGPVVLWEQSLPNGLKLFEDGLLT